MKFAIKDYCECGW